MKTKASLHLHVKALNGKSLVWLNMRFLVPGECCVNDSLTELLSSKEACCSLHNLAEES